MANCYPEYDLDRVTRDDLVTLLNEDLAREYRAVISTLVYSQVIKGSQYTAVATQLEQHAAEELAHAMVLAAQVSYLGGMPETCSKHVQVSFDPEVMLRCELQCKVEAIAHYRVRVGQCEKIGELATAQRILRILVQEQQHLLSLSNALGIDPTQASISWSKDKVTDAEALHAEAPSENGSATKVKQLM